MSFNECASLRPHLTKIPYEILLILIGYINFDDVINLAYTSKELCFLLEDEGICKMVLNEKLPFCDEVIEARKAGSGYAPAMRRVAKRHEAIATASPFSVAVIGVADYLTYYCGNICYIVDSTLRILDLYRAGLDEVVVSLPALLQKLLPKFEQGYRARFMVLYFNKGIASCLCTLNACVPISYLMVFDIQERKVLLKKELLSIERIFVRHDSRFLYYGTHSEENMQGQKQWGLRGYCFETEEWFKERLVLTGFYGTGIGSTICFEIFDGYFYGVSHQLSDNIEEVDWTSFYHGIRFPVGSPFKEFLEKTSLDEYTWRRQHKEGPIDDRWTTLGLRLDEATNDVNIVETRMEWIGRKRQRTSYSTILVFAPPSPSLGLIDKSILAVLTNDRLALTIGPRNNPHWFPAQIRLPRNVHPDPSDRRHCSFSKFHLQYYNSSAQTFIDLVDEPCFNDPVRRFRLRVSSRKLDRPAVGDNGIIITGVNDRFRDRPVAFWPLTYLWGSDDKRLQAQHKLMNPLNQRGEIQAFGDERSIVYCTGEKRQPMAIVFISFDPASRLTGAKSWNEQVLTGDECNGIGKERRTDVWKGKKQEIDGDHIRWIWTEPAMYRAIDRSYTCGLKRRR